MGNGSTYIVKYQTSDRLALFLIDQNEADFELNINSTFQPFIMNMMT